MVGHKYFKGGKRAFGGGQKYTKYNKINNNSENFMRQYCCPGGGGLFPSLNPLVAGLRYLSKVKLDYSYFPFKKALKFFALIDSMKNYKRDSSFA